MPHEVIMPALGMAQDTGKIVAWLKAAGDPVAEGEAILEVETDKATMEVEAQAAGYLTDLRAGEGDDVPVGDVIATISETADAAPVAADSAAPTANPAEPEASADGSREMTVERPEGTDVIMPALGMAQDTGKIVAWLKAPGDAVAEGDPLLEVETDKATMEVEAQVAGYLSATYAGDGDDVPVGDVIATITAEKPRAPAAHGRAGAPATETGPAGGAGTPAAGDAHAGAVPSYGAHPPEAGPHPQAGGAHTAEGAGPGQGSANRSASGAAAATERILASPKARRLAAERGIDLARLREAGVVEPFHVADLDHPLPEAPQHATVAAPTTPRARYVAEADGAGMADYLAWSGADAHTLLAALAAGALRMETKARHVALRLDRPRAAPATLTDPDRPLAHSGDAEPAMVLRDLTSSRVTAADAPVEPVPILTVARSGAGYSLTLETAPDAMGEGTAIAVLDRLARSLDDPLRHLI